jgi:hypothetical protein
MQVQGELPLVVVIDFSGTFSLDLDFHVMLT